MVSWNSGLCCCYSLELLMGGSLLFKYSVLGYFCVYVISLLPFQFDVFSFQGTLNKIQEEKQHLQS